jgi:hypothetical protein
MPHKFTDGKDDLDPEASGSGVRPPPPATAVDQLDPDHREPNEPPPALMRKKTHYAMWILLALALGGVIALIMVALGS